MAANTSHPSFLQPSNPDIWIWRYMDIAKYISFIKDKSLYFTRLDQFDDPYEGRPDNIFLDHINDMHFIAEDGELYPMPRNFIPFIIENLKNYPKEFFANCWHINSSESEAMWKLYGGQIAVRTQYSKLRDSLPESVALGKVQYKNYSSNSIDWTNAFNYPMHKRDSFSHENECRALISGLNDEYKEFSELSGIKVPINLDYLGLNIFIAPTAPSWIFDIILDINEKYQVKAHVLKSKLLDKHRIEAWNNEVPQT